MKCSASSSDPSDEESEFESPCHGQWQSLADDIWERMAEGVGGRLRKRSAGSLSAESSTANMLGFAPYQNVMRHWMTRGDSKRQRIAHASEASAGPPVAAPGKGAGKGLGKFAQSRGPPPPPKG